MPAALTVTVEKPKRGVRRVLVNGEPWGKAFLDRHGRRGVQFWFAQIGARTGSVIMEPGSRGRRVVAEGVADVERVAKDIVARGLLIDPTIAKAKEDEVAAGHAARIKEQEAAQRKRDVGRALKAIEANVIPATNEVDREGLANAIADLMQRVRDSGDFL